jgi:hypothetical protein
MFCIPPCWICQNAAETLTSTSQAPASGVSRGWVFLRLGRIKPSPPRILQDRLRYAA